MLNLADLLNLIRLTELEIIKLQTEVNSNDKITRNEAGEVIVQFDELSEKLKSMYIESRPLDSEYPTYDEYIDLVMKNKS